MSTPMVNTNTIVEISNEQPKSVSLNGPYLGFAINCYEAGMIQVLRGIAEDFLETAEIWISDSTRELNGIVEEKRREIEASFNSRDYALIKEYADSLSEADSSDAGDFYMQGWLDGYRYLANRVAYRGDGFYVSRFNKKDNKGNK